MNLIIKIFLSYSEIIIVLITLIVYLIIDYYLRKKNQKLKQKLHKKYNFTEQKSKIDIENKEDELELNYYKNKNIISLLRFGIIFFIITFYILHKIPNFFSFFAIAVGTIILVFKEVIQCFIGFFYVSTQYKLGDELVIPDGKGELKGEIIYLNILNVGLIGRDENGENNGQFYRVPNYKFFIENIKKEDISLHKYKKEEIIINYSKKEFSLGFQDFIEKLISYLDSQLPKRNITNVGNFNTYIGHKYKIKLEYDKDILKIKINFIVIPKNIFDFQKELFCFIEKLKN